MADFDPDALILRAGGSELITQAKLLGLQTANEVFADRTYQVDGTLTPRTQANALLEDDDRAVAQILQMVSASAGSSRHWRVDSP
ncbi:LamB/YcsF family protein [Vibrio sp. PP-XX7]